MEIDTETLTPEAHRAIVECLKIAARRGRQLREERVREHQTETTVTQGTTDPNETSRQPTQSTQSQAENRTP